MPDSTEYSLRECDVEKDFGIKTPFSVRAFTERVEHVPETDETYRFDEAVTRAVLLGFSHNRRVFLHGPHGSGKTSHIEQVASRLNWPCVRINLDSHITRTDLIGRDMVRISNGSQVTEFVPGLLVWALERPVALIFDEYDAGRPDVMFVIQRVLESEGNLTLLDQNRVVKPNPFFRLFATGNTSGSGDLTGLYVGTQALNQAQMDRWQVVCEVDYLSQKEEIELICRKFNQLQEEKARLMVSLAHLCRRAHNSGDVTPLFSLRTLISWIENNVFIGDLSESFCLTFANRLDEQEFILVNELFQRCFDQDLAPKGV